MDNETRSLPMVALRGLTIMPEMIVHFDVSRERSIAAIQQAMVEEQEIFLVAQKSIETENPGQDDVYETGTVASVKQLIKLSKKVVRVLVEGKNRAVLKKIEETDPYLRAEVEVLEEQEITIPDDLNAEAMMRGLKEIITEYAAKNGKISKESVAEILDITDLKRLVNEVAANIPLKYKDQQELLEELDFWSRYEKDPQEATDYFYKLSQDSDYIRRYRVKKDQKWTVDSEYGKIDITINLSKPEKDPKAIAAAGKAKSASYPKCQLCMENEGYAGRSNHPARENHRIIPITIQGRSWGFQYSPYVYYNEHCIVFNAKHTPMKIDEAVFVKLLDFVRQFPHYTLGSNADLPIVGGSILSHDHFQGGAYTFAMAEAPYEYMFEIAGFEDVTAGCVKWPLSVIRLQGSSIGRLAKVSDYILQKWRGYTDEEAFIFSETDGVPHNTITPIARMNGNLYEMDLVLRNNITTEDRPWGVYHPEEKLHHIKKENIGLIEVMGLAVLPSRLKKEMDILAKAIIEGKNIHDIEEIKIHADWVDEWLDSYDITTENIESIIQKEIADCFVQVLECAGVYKRTEKGFAAFKRFLSVL